MVDVLVDSNVLLDVVTEDAVWFTWSSRQLEALADQHTLVINPVIYSEVSVGFERIEDLDSVLTADAFQRQPIPWEAASSRGSASSATGAARVPSGLHCGTSSSAPMPPFAT